MHNRIIPIVVLFSVLLSSCKDEVDTKWIQTMEVHDQVMVKMGEINALSAELNTLILKVKGETNSETTPPDINALREAYEKLNTEGQAMMNWMVTIHHPKNGLARDSALQYLNERENAIIQIGEGMDNAIENAKSVLHKVK